MKRIIGTILFWLLWPALWIYLYRTHRTRVLLVCGDEFLALQGWLSPGDWDLPGGGLRRGEAAVAGVIRETLEETGVSLEPHRLQLVDDKGELAIHSYGFRFKYQAFVYEVDSKPELRLQRHEILQAAWLPLAGFDAKRCTPILIQVLNRWQAPR